MNLEADIEWIAKELRVANDPDFIEFIKSLLQDRQSHIHKKNISIKQYNKEIEDAEKDIEAGNFYTSQEVKEIMQQWGRK